MVWICGCRAMSRDPEHYPDPEHFNPDRFLLEGQLNPNIRDPESFVFGFGRRRVPFDLYSCPYPPTLALSFRICPGRHFADDEVWLMAATVLACFNVTQRGDVRPSEKMCSGVVWCALSTSAMWLPI